ncbi:MAG: hypothetical protein ABI986_09280 [Chloroflexota bacterium]
MTKFLLLIDVVKLANRVSNILLHNSFEVIGEPNLDTGFRRIQETKPDFVIMNITDDQSKNLKLHYQLRTSDNMEILPILMINDKNYKISDKIPGLISTRLDDYITDPFDLFGPDEFLLRIRYLLDRATSLKQT